MRDDLVSIIIPAYNAEKHIERSVMSAVKQSYSNIEVIIINGGSRVSTEEILRQLADRNANVSFYTQKNSGVAAARNVGLKHAKGAFYMFLDADDALMENAVELMYSSANENNADIVAADYYTVDLTRNQTQWIHIAKASRTYLPRETISLAVEDDPITYSCCAKLYRSQKLRHIRFPEGMRAHEDNYYVFQCLMCDVLVTALDVPLYKIYVTPGSATRSDFGDKYNDILFLVEKKRRLLKQSISSKRIGRRTLY